ncbi:restriction endonuclease subunit S [Bacillus sp. A015]
MGSKSVPEVRFKGFSGEWDECKIVDVLNINSGRDYKHLKKGDIPVYGTGGYMHSVNDKLSDDDAIGIGRKGTINKPQLLLAPFWTVDTLFYMTVKGKNDLYFLYSLANRIDWKKYDESTGVPSLSKNSIYKISINVPLLREQTQIGNFFKQLDETIAFQQQELDTLKQTKQGFLQKMFPKEGESVPEIRFSGFSGEWEAKCLGEISESYSGGTPSVDNKTFYGGDIPFIRSAEINSKTTEIYITEEGFNSSSTKMVRVGDILYALYGATSGEVGISKINGAINQAVLAIKPKRGYDSYFLTQWLKKQKSSIINTYLQGGQGNLSGSIVKKLILKIPFDEKEQTEIGHFFKQLDKTIALHEQELDILKQTKKAFLQKMFV